MYLLPSNIWSIVMPRTRTDFTDGIGIASDKPACRRVAPLAGTVLILMLVIASVPDGMRGALGADSLADSDSSRRVELELDERAAAFRAGLLNGGDGQGMTSSRRQLLQNGNFTLPAELLDPAIIGEFAPSSDLGCISGGGRRREGTIYRSANETFQRFHIGNMLTDCGPGSGAYEFKYDDYTGMPIWAAKLRVVPPQWQWRAFFHTDGSVGIFDTFDADNWAEHYTFPPGEQLLISGTTSATLPFWYLNLPGVWNGIPGLMRPHVPPWIPRGATCDEPRPVTSGQVQACVDAALAQPLRLAVVVLNWTDVGPVDADYDEIRNSFGSNWGVQFWADMSQGQMAPWEFAMFRASIDLPATVNATTYFNGTGFASGDNGLGQNKRWAAWDNGDGLLCSSHAAVFNSQDGPESETGRGGSVSSLEPLSQFNPATITEYNGTEYDWTVFIAWNPLCRWGGAYGGWHWKLDGLEQHTWGVFFSHPDLKAVWTAPEWETDWTHPLHGPLGNDNNTLTFVHEMGHALSLAHSNAWAFDPGAPKPFNGLTQQTTEGFSAGYGNKFSVMGGVFAAMSLPPAEMYSMHYLHAPEIVEITENGRYTIAPLHSVQPPATGLPRAAILWVNASHRVPWQDYETWGWEPLNKGLPIWLELRAAIGYDLSLGWEGNYGNTMGLMASQGTDLFDLDPIGSGVSHDVGQKVTLDQGASWLVPDSADGPRPCTITNVLVEGEGEGNTISFDVFFGDVPPPPPPPPPSESCSVEHGVEYLAPPHADLSTGNVTADPGGCCALCSQTERCVAWVHYQETGNCTLRDRFQTYSDLDMVPNANATSGHILQSSDIHRPQVPPYVYDWKLATTANLAAAAANGYTTIRYRYTGLMGNYIISPETTLLFNWTGAQDVPGLYTHWTSWGTLEGAVHFHASSCINRSIEDTSVYWVSSGIGVGCAEGHGNGDWKVNPRDVPGVLDTWPDSALIDMCVYEGLFHQEKPVVGAWYDNNPCSMWKLWFADVEAPLENVPGPDLPFLPAIQNATQTSCPIFIEPPIPPASSCMVETGVEYLAGTQGPIGSTVDTINVTDFSECCDLCNVTYRCVAWTFFSIVNYTNHAGNCVMHDRFQFHDTSRDRVLNANAVSGYLPPEQGPYATPWRLATNRTLQDLMAQGPPTLLQYKIVGPQGNWYLTPVTGILWDWNATQNVDGQYSWYAADGSYEGSFHILCGDRYTIDYLARGVGCVEEGGQSWGVGPVDHTGVNGGFYPDIALTRVCDWMPKVFEDGGFSCSDSAIYWAEVLPPAVPPPPPPPQSDPPCPTRDLCSFLPGKEFRTRFGSDAMRGVVDSTQTPNEGICCDLCSMNPLCSAWTFYPNTGTCFLQEAFQVRDSTFDKYNHKGAIAGYPVPPPDIWDAENWTLATPGNLTALADQKRGQEMQLRYKYVGPGGRYWLSPPTHLLWDWNFPQDAPGKYSFYDEAGAYEGAFSVDCGVNREPTDTRVTFGIGCADVFWNWLVSPRDEPNTEVADPANALAHVCIPTTLTVGWNTGADTCPPANIYFAELPEPPPPPDSTSSTSPPPSSSGGDSAPGSCSAEHEPHRCMACSCGGGGANRARDRIRNRLHHK